MAALAESVKSFDGAVVCVSHDQFFVNAIANEAWVVGGPSKLVKRVESFGHYRDAQLKKLHQAEAAQNSKMAPAASSAKANNAKKANAPAKSNPAATATKAKGQGPAKAKKGDAFWGF